MTRKNNRNSERGQALLPFALVFVALFGMVGLVLDVGWSYYVGKKAQTAADAAAQAAVAQALTQNGPSATPDCSTLGCQAATSCPSTSDLLNACQYASVNGFSAGGDSGRQTVMVAAGSGGTAPGVPNVPVDYWVQVTMSNSLPQWFSGFFTSKGFTPTATATAALRRTNLNASLYLLNRASDCFVSALNIGVICGEDYLSLGLNTVNAGGGIYMSSSNGSGLGLPAIAAATVTGLATVTAPFTYVMGQGGVQDVLGVNSWTTAPMNGFPDGDYFSDPFAGLPQPPAPTGLPDHPVPLGAITGSLFGPPTVLPPGNYYATLPLLGTPTGLPIVITGNVVFSDGAANPCGGFCNYVFYGGVVTALGTMTFSPGEYVFAGAQPIAGGPGVGLSGAVGVSTVMQDLTPLSGGKITQNTDAGEIFIFTSSHYPGLQLPAALQNSGLSFPQVQAGFMGGVEPQITLHGINKNSPNLPAALLPYAPVLIWQDRANTTLKYTPNGLLDMSCGGICSNVLSIPGSQEMIVMASQNGGNPGTNLFGTIYGPRGSWLTILGVLPGDTVAGPLQIVSGALQMTLNASLIVDPLPNPPSRLVAGLIQ
jgi:Flp pilus assembly protein TadG